MSTQIVVVGAGGFGREAIDVVQCRASHDASVTLVGVLDDAPSDLNLQRLAMQGVAYLGSLQGWLEALDSDPTVQFVVAIGSCSVRGSIAKRLEDWGLSAATIIHPSAIIGSRVSLGAGTVVCGGVHISTNASVGRHVHLNPNATIGHDTVLHDEVSVNPGAIISGDVTVYEGVLVGAGSVVLEGRTIGRRAIIGASACVTHDVAANSVMVGVPARSIVLAGEDAM